jgi:hypothetical protein
MEVEFLRKRDFENRIKFTDLSSDDYNPADHGFVSFESGMRKIRAVMPDQTVIVGEFNDLFTDVLVDAESTAACSADCRRTI